MPEETNQTVEPNVNNDSSNSTVTQQPTTPATPSVDWEARYKGTVKKIEELTLTNRDLASQLTNLKSQNEQFQISLGEKDASLSVAVGERDNRIKELVQSQSEQAEELKKLRALNKKLDIARELGRVDLMEIIHTIPNLDDEETLRNVMADIAKFTDKKVSAREQQLLAGTTLPMAATGGAGNQQALPTTNEGWKRYLNEVPLGSAEYDKRLVQWSNDLERVHK